MDVRKSSFGIFAAMLALSGIAAAQPQRGNGFRGQGAQQASCRMLSTIPLQDLTADEAAGLAFMREEEKLARDVYQRLYETWGLPVFARISISEQRHFDALGMLLTRYQLVDPAQGRAAGEFSDPRLATLYGDLIALGQTSSGAALRVGASIEDLDIRDLHEAIDRTDNVDLATVYRNLLRGSGNHLRAFVGQLASLGESYQAQYLSAEELAGILASPQGRGNSAVRRAGRGGNDGSCPFGNTP